MRKETIKLLKIITEKTGVSLKILKKNWNKLSHFDKDEIRKHYEN